MHDHIICKRQMDDLIGSAWLVENLLIDIFKVYSMNWRYILHIYINNDINNFKLLIIVFMYIEGKTNYLFINKMFKIKESLIFISSPILPPPIFFLTIKLSCIYYHQIHATHDINENCKCNFCCSHKKPNSKLVGIFFFYFSRASHLHLLL